jgi:hypothetical protein
VSIVACIINSYITVAFEMIIVPITVKNLSIFQLFVPYLKLYISETGFSLRLQVEPTQLDLINVSGSLSPKQGQGLSLANGPN